MESDSKTLLLVGRAGNGKSATGNTILGRKEFESRCSLYGVTKSCQSQRTVRDGGRIFNIIDTPGLFDLSMESELLRDEMKRCIALTENGIDAVLLVFSTRYSLTEVEKSGIRQLESLFGRKFFDYVIMVFTCGDELEDSEETLAENLARGSPGFMIQLFQICGNRFVLFDNETTDGIKNHVQVESLLSLVESISLKNGTPFKGESGVNSENEEGSGFEQHELVSEKTKGLESNVAELHELETEKKTVEELVDGLEINSPTLTGGTVAAVAVAMAAVAVVCYIYRSRV